MHFRRSKNEKKNFETILGDAFVHFFMISTLFLHGK